MKRDVCRYEKQNTPANTPANTSAHTRLLRVSFHFYTRLLGVSSPQKTCVEMKYLQTSLRKSTHVSFHIYTRKTSRTLLHFYTRLSSCRYFISTHVSLFVPTDVSLQIYTRLFSYLHAKNAPRRMLTCQQKRV